MRVVLVNHSDSRGGASVVTVRLLHALRRAGVEADMLVTHKSLPDEPHIHLIGNALTRRAAFLAEAAEIYIANGHNRLDLFKASTGTFGISIHNHPLVRQCDAVILNWVNQGTLSLDEIGRLGRMGKKILLTQHDMWGLTGICHHAGECQRFHDGCGDCPLIHRAPRAKDLSHHIFRRKQQLYRQLCDKLTLVAVSTWLARKARESALTADVPLAVIPNAFPTGEYLAPPRYSRAELGLPPDVPLVAMGAARLDDPVKGLPYAVDTLNGLTDTPWHAVFFGNLRDASALDGLRLPYTYLGPLDADAVRSVYSHSRAVLSTSLYETLPGTLVEGMAAGAFAVSFDRGGQADIITSAQVGTLVPLGDTEGAAKALDNLLSHPHDPEMARRSVAEKFDDAIIAKKYIELLSE